MFGEVVLAVTREMVVDGKEFVAVVGHVPIAELRHRFSTSIHVVDNALVLDEAIFLVDGEGAVRFLSLTIEFPLVTHSSPYFSQFFL